MAGMRVLYVSLTAAVALALPPLMAQQKPISSNKNPQRDTIDFVVTSPPTGTELERGKVVAFEATVECELATRTSAFIRVIAQDERGEELGRFVSSEAVNCQTTRKWAGKMTIRKKAKAIHLVAQLYELVELPLAGTLPPEMQLQAVQTEQPRVIAASREVRFATREGLPATAR